MALDEIMMTDYLVTLGISTVVTASSRADAQEVAHQRFIDLADRPDFPFVTAETVSIEELDHAIKEEQCL